MRAVEAEIARAPSTQDDSTTLRPFAAPAGAPDSLRRARSNGRARSQETAAVPDAARLADKLEATSAPNALRCRPRVSTRESA